jgi:hypothetical protein
MRDEGRSFIAYVMQDSIVARSSDPMAGMTADSVSAALPWRGQVALRLVEASILMLRVAAILVLLSPVLGVAILFG